MNLRLDAPYDHYFDARPEQTFSTPPLVVVARSNNGLTDSFQGAAVRGGNYPEPLSYNCTQYQAQNRSLNYASTLYGYTFKFSVLQYRDGPLLVIDDYSRLNGSATRLRFHFATGEAEPIEYRDATQGLVANGPRATVSELPTLTVGSRTYNSVWRLTNTYLAQYGPATAATVFYLSPTHGLVRFEQRDGTVWDLAL
ncbi:hypothetical protein [Hymenobacter cellulosilyticus]|uniref:Uncharacterized protein n=1 Tax=Hymenobacter cellulosilyticus TaxID=2932248 RepID=A0A8T9QE19_9BACT|nr:hypothetical protein [Hymenobacter cellulosilyticus]UOQ74388.1 hypothetical protein MUN79_11190 [Hymenobacter cellulosilyticus]